MKVGVLSDTHCQHDQVAIEPCDILIHGGDISHTGRPTEVKKFLDWFKKQPAEHKILIPGNHDFNLIDYPEFGDVYLLHHEHVTINGYTFFGSPYTPEFFKWAYMYPRGEYGATLWKEIPEFTDILITHGPPFGIGDANDNGEHCGCPHLYNRVLELKPKYHIFGHIHEGAGVHLHKSIAETTFINASILNAGYIAVHHPHYFTLPTKDTTFELHAPKD